MKTYVPNIASLSRIILGAYETQSPETADDRQVNESLVGHLRTWLESCDRTFTPAAQYSINRFVDAELDYVTAGNRGMGRMTEEWPRFGGKHRRVLSSFDSTKLGQFKTAFADEIAIGYLFAEYLVECFSGNPVPRAQFENATVDVFEQWIPTIYSIAGPSQFDEKFSANNDSYYDVKGLWGHAGGDVIYALFRSNGIPVDEFEKTLIRQYFDAGVMLRVNEMRKMSPDEHADIVTGGGFSIAKEHDAKARVALPLVKAIYEFRTIPRDPADIIEAISAVGLTMADVQSNPDLVFEAGIARGFRRACKAMDIPITPHQSLTLAKHLRVGADCYRDGIRLSDHERSVALELYRIYFRAFCEEQGTAFSEEHARDCERRIKFGERGLHIGHKIGEASGCFQVILVAVIAVTAVVSAIVELVHLVT